MGPSEPGNDPVAPSAGASWRALRLAALSVVLLALLLVLALLLRPEGGGAYRRLEHDHDELMVSRTPNAAATVTVLFVGNSLTFTNDLPAMLVNLASTDPGNQTRLQVKAETSPGASLAEMYGREQALNWARDHHPGYVVLQEQSFWYNTDFEATYAAVSRWSEALKPLHAAPLLFEVWTNGEGSEVFTHGTTVADDARSAAEGAERLGQRTGLPVVAVGQAFEAARRTPGAPNLYGPDRHHPSVAGSYLAALVFYRSFTGRTGAEATYRPNGLSPQDAAVLVRLNGG